MSVLQKRNNLRPYKAYGRLCEGCGCRLDPGEGRLCEDCLEEKERREQAGRMRSAQTPPAVV